MWGVMNEYKRVEAYINQAYDVEYLLRDMFGIRVNSGEKFLCPFHNDNRKSARIYDDNAFYCFAENRQYTPYWILINSGKTYHELARLVPRDFHDYLIRQKYFDETFYKTLVLRLSDTYKRRNDIASVIDNWNSVLKNREEKKMSE